MVQKSHYTILLMMLILIGTSFNATQVQGVDIWTAHVKWVGYDFLNDDDCGDGYAGACENKLKVKRTTSTSCTSRSWTEGVEKSNYPGVKYLNGYYEITWFRVGSAPLSNI